MKTIKTQNKSAGGFGRQLLALMAVVLLLPGLSLRAQVTIGSGEEPAKAALLDIKEQNSASGGATATSGGVLLPRVNLVSLTTLEPFISGGGSATEKTTHKGLVVYNLTDNSTFKPGLYYWDGAQWNMSKGVDITANNGLTKTGDNIQLGGVLTKATTISGSSSNNLTVSAPLAITSGSPGLNKVLTSDISGNATWQSLPTGGNESTTAANGLTLSGTEVQLGGTLKQATTINHSTFALNHTGTGALSIANPTTVSGSLRYTGSTPTDGYVLTTDGSGNATWKAPATATGESTTASNGLTRSTYDVQLGGTLSKATNIELGNYNLSFSRGGSGRVGIGTTSPDASAVLDMTSTNKGVLVPRVALSSGAGVSTPVSSPATGLLVYNTVNAGSGTNTVKANNFYFWNGSRWSPIMQTEIIQEELDKLRIPQPAMYRLETSIPNFLDGHSGGDSRAVPLTEVFNSIPSKISYNPSNSMFTIAAGTYIMSFTYEGIIFNAPCDVSSYFVDFPGAVRIHSTAATSINSNASHGGTITYSVQLTGTAVWQMRLGRGQSGNCWGDLILNSHSTFLSIQRFGD